MAQAEMQTLEVTAEDVSTEDARRVARFYRTLQDELYALSLSEETLATLTVAWIADGGVGIVASLPEIES